VKHFILKRLEWGSKCPVMQATLTITMDRTTVYKIESPFIRKRNMVVAVHMGMKGEIPQK